MFCSPVLFYFLLKLPVLIRHNKLQHLFYLFVFLIGKYPFDLCAVSAQNMNFILMERFALCKGLFFYGRFEQGIDGTMKECGDFWQIFLIGLTSPCFPIGKYLRFDLQKGTKLFLFLIALCQ